MLAPYAAHLRSATRGRRRRATGRPAPGVRSRDTPYAVQAIPWKVAVTMLRSSYSTARSVSMIILGIILILLGLLVSSLKILLTIGIIVLVVGLVVNFIPIGGTKRRWY
jgi:hypothetical protein